jgi:3',5'-cyclic-AMP phosphodiesterase
MPLEVLQISDLHLTEPGVAMLGRDADETLQSVLADVERRGLVPDVVVASGDLVHDGAPGGYPRLGTLLTTIGAPVYCLAGNHDLADLLATQLPRDGVHLERFARFGDWAFVFVDSNRNGRTRNEHGALVDLADRGHAARLGAVDAAELDWLERAVRSTDAAHVFVWIHHPPVVHPKFQPAARSAYCESLMDRLSDPRVRAIGAGHLHCGFEAAIDGLTMYGCPSTWLVMDFDTDTIAPPGYRWYSLYDDGHIESVVYASDDRRFAERAPLPAFVVKLMTGEMGLGSSQSPSGSRQSPKLS